MSGDDTMSLKLGSDTSLMDWETVSMILTPGYEYECECVALAALLPEHTLEQVKQAVEHVAEFLSDEGHGTPGHLREMIENEHCIKTVPGYLRLTSLLESPIECSEGCVEKFYKFLGGEK